MTDTQIFTQLGAFDIHGNLDKEGRLILKIESRDGTEVLFSNDTPIDFDRGMILTTEAISLASR